ncbi:MAG: hypothetical protein RLN70_00185 [Rhodospirillaceae bacterium]
MSDDRLEAMRKRMADRLKASSQGLSNKLSGRVTGPSPTAQTTPTAIVSQASLQAGNELFFAAAQLEARVGASRYGDGDATTLTPPPPPTGQWRCIVESPYVSIDLVANISEGHTLTAQGTLIYTGTLRVYEVSGPGDWLAMPPDKDSTKWLFSFMLKPSTHAVFRWFASPTDSPNHLHNRWVHPETGQVVETWCERTA